MNLCKVCLLCWLVDGCSTRQDDVLVVHVLSEFSSVLETPFKTELLVTLSKRYRAMMNKNLVLEFSDVSVLITPLISSHLISSELSALSIDPLGRDRSRTRQRDLLRSSWSQPWRTGSLYSTLSSDEMRSDEATWDEMRSDETLVHFILYWAIEKNK